MEWDILRDQIWDFIGVIVAVITLIITLVITYFQKHKKGITYDFISKTSLISTKEKLEGKLKIFYEGNEVEDVKLVEIRIANTGSIAIPSQDYERPLKFTFPKESKLLSTEVIKCSPENLIIEFDSNNNEIIFRPVLLNSKDSFVFKSIVSKMGKNEDLNVDCRIKDIKEIKNGKDGSGFLIWMFLGLIVTISGLYQIVRIEYNIPKQEIPWTTEKTVAIVLSIIGYIILSGALMTNERGKKILLSIFR